MEPCRLGVGSLQPKVTVQSLFTLFKSLIRVLQRVRFSKSPGFYLVSGLTFFLMFRAAKFQIALSSLVLLINGVFVLLPHAYEELLLLLFFKFLHILEARIQISLFF